jgi:integrase
VRRHLTRVRIRAATLAESETARGRRALTLSPTALAALRAHRARQAKDRLALGPDYADGGKVFGTRTGAPLLHSNVVRSFKRLLARVGLPRAIRLYDLRHANATALLAAGVHPKVTSERLGHPGVTLFMYTYSHLLPGLEVGATAALEAVLGPAAAG